MKEQSRNTDGLHKVRLDEITCGLKAAAFISCFHIGQLGSWNPSK